MSGAPEERRQTRKQTEEEALLGLSPLGSEDEFLTADYESILAVKDTPEYQWLLENATVLVERECERRHCEKWELLDIRHVIESPRVQRALDILMAGGFITKPAE